MKRTNHRREAAMRELLRVLARMAGSVVGWWIGGWLLLFGEMAVVGQMAPDDTTGVGLPVVIFLYALAFLVGGAPGAAVGATIVQKILRRRSSFWKALLGAVVGSVIPFIGTVIGAVIGSDGPTQPTAPSTGTWPPVQ
jgi:hypothetical protein